MDYAWKVHKKFILAVGAGVVAVFLYNAFVLSGMRKAADRAAQGLQEEREKVERSLQDGEPTDGALKEAELARDQSVKQLGQLREDMTFRAPDRFKKPETGAKSYTDRLKLDVPRALVAEAAKKNIGCPLKVGLDENFPDEMSEEVLFRLALLDRVVNAAIQSGVERIDQIDALHGADQKLEPVGKKGVFLNRFSLLMKFRGPEESVWRLLLALQKKGSCLGLLHFELDRPTPAKDSLACTIAVSAFRVDDKSPIEVRP